MFENIHIAKRETFDAIVVGSGISGGWAAKELTEKGLKTLVLERGPLVKHGEYPTEWKQPWEYYFRGKDDQIANQKDYPVQSRGGGFSEGSKHFYVKDTENPYISPEDKPFMWIRGHQVGGRSLIWGRQCYRLSDLDFEANARDGHGADWPIRYADIAPWYDYVERFVGISGRPEGMPQLPDGNFLPPMEMNCTEVGFKERMERAFSGRKMTIGRVANLTVQHQGRGPCQFRNQCSRGCSFGGYFSSNASTLPAAEATGNMTLRPNSVVHSVIYDENNDKAVGVRVIDAETREQIDYFGRIIFLNASALESARILLNSKTPRYSDGLANSSGAVGHYLMDHCFQAGASGDFPEFDDSYHYGRRPNGIYIIRFRNLGTKETEAKDFLRGYGFQGGASRPGWSRGASAQGFGADFKNALQDPGSWNMWIGGWGECLPRYENYMELDASVTDAWGIPALRIVAAWSENEDNMRKDMSEQGALMLEAAGAKNINPFINFSPPGLCIHEMGTARMGRDAKTSVLNAHNQAWDVPNLFITDGACMASSACQNPSITYMALTARAADFAVAEMKRGNL